MEPALTEAGLTGTRMLLQVHDELVFEVPESEVEAAKPVIERVMATAAEPSVKLDVPLAVVSLDTHQAAEALEGLAARVTVHHPRKIDHFAAVLAERVDWSALNAVAGLT